jgi:hypothetical protein
MTWVLILSSTVNGRHPAVIGGYIVRAEAEAAGELATAWDATHPYPATPFYDQYIVIPGNAEADQGGSTRCWIDRDYDSHYKLTRHYQRFDARWTEETNANLFAGVGTITQRDKFLIR